MYGGPRLKGIFFLSLVLSSFNACFARLGENKGKSPSRDSPFTAKASLIRYWNKHISNNLPKPSFLFSKASPLNAVGYATLTKLATQNALSSHLESFCSSANLFCLFDSLPTLEMPEKDANFAVYSNKRFATYGTSRLGGADSFKNYSDGINIPNDLFTCYNKDSTGHDETITNYTHDANVANGTFTNYGSGATGGSGEFKNYDPLVNVPHLRFTSYDLNANDYKLSFSSYTDDTNSGDEAFTSYGKSGNGVPTEFINYGDNSNAIGSTFSAYGESGNGANDTFKGYGHSANKPHNNFKGYGNGGNSAIDSFSNYRDEANVGVDTFQSYAKNSNSARASFANYGKSFNEGEDSFKEYAKGSVNQAVGFKIYGLNSTFKVYADKSVTFSHYSNSSSATSGVTNNSGNSVNRWVEPGKFFRESMLKEGNVMVMPDIRDRMPKRSFLPPAISSKLPFSITLLSSLKEIFHAQENSTMERVITNALAECERASSQGETKRCVGSVEDMIDFAISVLGHDIVVRSTQNVNGSKENVMIGKVRGINGGKCVPFSICHASH